MKGTCRKNFPVAALVLAGLSGCLSGEDPEVGFYNSRPRQDVSVTGNVGDVLTAKSQVSINAADGEDLGDITGSDAGAYSRDVEAPTRHYPLLVTAKGGENLITRRAPEFVLRGAVTTADSTVVANANAFSTLAVEVATNLNGGLTSANLKDAERLIVENMNSGLDALVGRGPMSTPIDNANIAELVKASATLSEIFLRTRAALVAAGTDVDVEDVIRALGADLIDGVIEGSGGDAANPRIAATAAAVTAQVLAESMTQELRIDGFRAMAALHQVVDQASDGAASPNVSQLALTSLMIAQWQAAIDAVAQASGNPVTQQVAGVATSIESYMSADEIWSKLPPGWSDALGDTVAEIAAADDATIAAVNAAARDASGNFGSDNRAPTLSGTPPDSVTANEPYSFTPRANDLDGDDLSFSITNRPSWLQFDSASGSLWGTPASVDEGMHENIRITVSDGLASSSIGPFSIAVAGQESAPSISGTPAASVLAGSNYNFRPNATDPDGDDLTFAISNKPAWANFSITTGQLSGTPQAVDVATYRNIVISVSDATFTDRLAPFRIEVIAADRQPGSVSVNWTRPTSNTNGSPLTNLAGYRVYWRSQAGTFNNSKIISNPGATGVLIDDLAPGNYDFVVTAFNSYGGESRFSNTTSKIVN